MHHHDLHQVLEVVSEPFQVEAALDCLGADRAGAGKYFECGVGDLLGWMARMTTYPFALPETLAEQLPPPSRDGNHYIDVCVDGKWDGILVVDGAAMAIGIYVGRRIMEEPLPFHPDQIEGVRPPSLWNRFLSSLPGDPFLWALLTIVVLSPVALGLARLLTPYLALFSIVGCAVSIHLMYQAGGFIFIRFPVAIWGIGQIAAGSLLILRHLRHLF